jgi:hypothetical protein
MQDEECTVWLNLDPDLKMPEDYFDGEENDYHHEPY